MKTKLYFTALLALIIRVMMNGQTPVNNAFQPDAHYVLGYANYTTVERAEFSAVQDPSELLLKAEALSAKAALLKQKAGSRSGKEKESLLCDAAELLRQADVRRLAASELQAFNNRAEFQLSKSSFLQKLIRYDQNSGSTIEAKRLLLNAVRTYHSAIELREEAYAQDTNAATIANLHNAEEQENKALIQLVQAMDALDAPAPVIVVVK